jgi:hypothetical protein
MAGVAVSFLQAVRENVFESGPYQSASIATDDLVLDARACAV